MATAGMTFQGNAAKVQCDYDPEVQRIQFTTYGYVTSSCDYEVFDEDDSVRKGSVKITENDNATKIIRFYMKKRP